MWGVSDIKDGKSIQEEGSEGVGSGSGVDDVGVGGSEIRGKGERRGRGN